MKRFLLTGSFFLVLLLLWEFLVRQNIWSHVLMPTPLEVLRYLANSIADGTLLQASYVTIKRLMFGYVAGIVFGIPIGLLNARYEFCEDTLGVIALGLQTLPSVCWAPLAVIWFGLTEKSIFFIVVMGSVWSIALATDTGVRNVPPIYVRAAQTMGSRGLHIWTHVIFPASLPFIVSGMKQGWAFAWRSLMAAEIYITVLTGFGLGNLLHYSREMHAMDTVIGVMVVVIFIGLVIDKCVFSPLENSLHRRWGTNRATRRG